MYIVLIILVFALLTFWVLNIPVFGKHPEGVRLQKIKNLPNYSDGEIKNLTLTPAKADDVSYFQLVLRAIKGNKNGSPKKTLPHVKPDFSSSIPFKLTWFGHSSYLIQLEGKNILVDPVFSEKTSPFQFLGTKRFDGTNFIQPDDLPNIDLMIITHDHYDHLDYASILKLKPKTRHFLTSMGVGAHLERWGIASNQITELVWGERTSPMVNFTFTATTARHFSGRGFKRNQTAWSSFVLKTETCTVFIGGDSGTGIHFKEIGEKYGPFDLSILECGQYNSMWPFIHMFPEEVAQAAIDLNSAVLMPVHWAKFRLALHDWDDPIKRLITKSDELGVKLATPMLGQSFYLNDTLPTKQWWDE
ncbi:MBL fold metallo-hydrolase [Pedobacter sp. Du54]|uniref:MBL fold metallo-hydrolase n=1 Tax=Pedobacter anseongensis TaxID=3133439 RepID=UPI0030AB166C